MDPNLLFSPSVKVEAATAKAPASGVEPTPSASQRLPTAAGASTKWLTQTRRDQEAVKKSQPQKIATGRKALSSSTRPAGKLRSHLLDPSGKSSITGTGTSVTVIKVKVPVPVTRPAHRETRLRDSVTPDALDTVTNSSPSGTKLKRKKTVHTVEDKKASRKGVSSSQAATQRKHTDAGRPSAAASNKSRKESLQPAKSPSSDVPLDAARLKPSKRKVTTARE